MSRYHIFVLALLPATLITVTVAWWIEKDTNSGLTWREVWMDMWEGR